MNKFTAEETISHITEWGAGTSKGTDLAGVAQGADLQAWLTKTLHKMNEWLRRGDGIAVYENQEPGHPEAGNKWIVSYGSPSSTLTAQTPPGALADPDGGPANQRYKLVGAYQGGPL